MILRKREWKTLPSTFCRKFWDYLFIIRRGRGHAVAVSKTGWNLEQVRRRGNNTLGIKPRMPFRLQLWRWNLFFTLINRRWESFGCTCIFKTSAFYLMNQFSSWLRHTVAVKRLTLSIICFIVWRRIMPELRWSVPASLGSLSGREDTVKISCKSTTYSAFPY